MYPAISESLRDILAPGVNEDVFRAGIDPIDLYISITSLPVYYIARHFAFDAIFKTKWEPVLRKGHVQINEHRILRSSSLR